MAEESTSDNIAIAAFVTFCCSVAAGVYEIYFWLRNGFKAGLTPAYALETWFKADLMTVYSPREWIGVAKIIQKVIELDLWVFLLLVSLLFIGYGIFSAGD
jgi:hypothetical protein